MPVKLVYHKETNSNSVSPFDKAIIKMIEGKETCLACPYLGLKYLKRLVSKTSSWRLLTDVEEWLLSHSVESRKEIKKYIIDNSTHIHHYSLLHAKVILTENGALVGSANFTESGITEKAEMAVLFENTEQVKELHNWFNKLWKQTESVNPDELEKCVKSMARISKMASKNHFSLSSKTPRIKSRFLEEEHQIDQLKTSTSRWEEAILKCIELHEGQASVKEINKAIPSFIKSIA